MSNRCPGCNSPNIYKGLNDIECPTRSCKNFSEKQLEAFTLELAKALNCSVRPKNNDDVIDAEFPGVTWSIEIERDEEDTDPNVKSYTFCDDDAKEDVPDEDTNPNYNPDDYINPEYVDTEVKWTATQRHIDAVIIPKPGNFPINYMDSLKKTRKLTAHWSVLSAEDLRKDFELFCKLLNEDWNS